MVQYANLIALQVFITPFFIWRLTDSLCFILKASLVPHFAFISCKFVVANMGHVLESSGSNGSLAELKDPLQIYHVPLPKR